MDWKIEGDAASLRGIQRHQFWQVPESMFGLMVPGKFLGLICRYTQIPQFLSTYPASPSLLKSKLGKRHFICKGQCHFGMLQHVIKAEELNLILRCMDLLVAVLEIRFNHKSRWVSIFRGRGMI